MKHVCRKVASEPCYFFYFWKYSCKNLACKILTKKAIQNWVGNKYGFSLYEL